MNIRKFTEYMRRVLENGTATGTWEDVSAETHGIELLMTGLRRSRGVHLEDLSRQTGLDMEQRFAEPIDRLIQAGLLQREGDQLQLTEDSIPVSDAVFLEFF